MKTEMATFYYSRVSICIQNQSHHNDSGGGRGRGGAATANGDQPKRFRYVRLEIHLKWQKEKKISIKFHSDIYLLQMCTSINHFNKC